MASEVLLAGEFTGTQDVDMSAALRDVRGACARVTIAVVAVPPRMLCYGMPFCGVALIEQANDSVLRDAGRRACRLASAAPEGVCVQHMVVESWGDLVRHARRRAYDQVLLAEPPTRMRDRLRVRRAGWRAGQAAPAAPSSVSEAPNVSTNPISPTGRRRSFVGKPRAG